MTKNAELILNIVNESKEHLTAEQIFMKSKELSPKIVLATVYNNINRLVEEGLIRRISMEGCPDRYDNMTRHDHLICDRCGRLSDVKLEDFTEQFQKELGEKILSYDLKIHYVCGKCRKNKV